MPEPDPGSAARPDGDPVDPARPATIYSVAERAGVSIASVSRVLQGSTATSARTRDKVLTAVRELEYLPQTAARSLAVRRSEAHGVVLGDLGGPYYSELMLGYQSVAARHGQSVVLRLLSAADSAEDAVRELAGRVDGMTIAAPDVADETVAALARSLPIVLVGRDPVPGCQTLTTENVDTAEVLARHLLDHGRRRLLFVGEPAGSHDVTGRYAGFRRAVQLAGLAEPGPLAVAQTEASGRAVVADRADRWREADALVCANDELALAIQDSLLRRGVRVPDDIAVVGWDDVRTARYVRPGLTTVAQPVHELGELAAQWVHDRVAGDVGSPTALTLPTRPVYRQSCGCPDAAPTERAA
ncbi:LacI family DNA-binding transcriptional regulator [Nakamurella flavida]|uniref:LacI family DNA-binding transcriptional regulator n=1 Tax=Nakamurella flavida TaxID=363630 RepID=A0A939C1Y8_9ACTN|nr:LacI family DNA-binding transcriptional regulator [Nakamurella flavida]MBM9478183.1 LacI family DNA-binding transcriptional regulator [Nakamurella flavida]MDP9778595.1 LacI family transcriptional regulator [Nakamurella flavida]